MFRKIILKKRQSVNSSDLSCKLDGQAMEFTVFKKETKSFYDQHVEVVKIKFFWNTNRTFYVLQDKPKLNSEVS